MNDLTSFVFATVRNSQWHDMESPIILDMLRQMQDLSLIHIYKVGDLNKSKDFKLKGQIVPATLEEISKEGLISSIHSVKQYAIENGKVVGITYIHLDS